MCDSGLNFFLFCPFRIGTGLKQIDGLHILTDNCHLLCFALNPFLHGVLVCVENIYRRTDGPTDRQTNKVRVGQFGLQRTK